MYSLEYTREYVPDLRRYIRHAVARAQATDYTRAQGSWCIPPSLVSGRHTAIIAEAFKNDDSWFYEAQHRWSQAIRGAPASSFAEPQSIVFDASAAIAACRPLVNEGGITTSPEHVPSRWLVVSHRVRGNKLGGYQKECRHHPF